MHINEIYILNKPTTVTLPVSKFKLPVQRVKFGGA